MGETRAKHLPGEVGVWVFILGDMLVFTLLFATYLYYRIDATGIYLEGQASLRQDLAAINTLLLLTSSWFAVLALSSARSGRLPRARAWLLATAACGGAFAILKYVEYREKFAAGINLLSNDFYTYYFILTGIHLLHVLVGIGVLLFLARYIGGAGKSFDSGFVESGCAYWHMVDFLWIFIFSLIYLMP